MPSTHLQDILSVIPGPAFVIRGAHIVYFAGDVTVKIQREWWNPPSANFGNLGQRLKSSEIIVSGTPVGEIESLTTNPGYWPLTPAMIGQNIVVSTPLSVVPAAGNKITFPYSGPSKMPPLDLKPTGTAWGAIEWTCLGDPAIEPDAAGFFAVLASTTTDTSFDATKVISPRYTGAWGSDSWAVIEPEDGFQIEPIAEFDRVYAANYGLIKLVLKSLGLTIKCIPINQTEANYLAALKLDGSGALRPGDMPNKSADLRDSFIITDGAASFTFTGKYMGMGDGGFRYGTSVLRQGEAMWYNRINSSAGVASPLWTLT